MASNGFTRGVQACADMLESLDVDECTIAGVNVLSTRQGRPQDNAVRRTLGRILERRDSDELEGFCAALTDIVASADESGDYYRMFCKLASRQTTTA